MTSEIVIMNDEAIVMAADSIATISDQKIQNDVNKLFMLSNYPPIGIMIFGSAQFEGISLEALIKDYSRKTNFNKLDDILLIKKDFINFLTQKTPSSNESEFIEEGLNIIKEVIVDFNNIDINTYDGEKILSFLENNFYDDKFKKIIDDYNLDIDINLFKRFFSSEIMNLSSGIIIAGFNEKDMFPSLVTFNLIFNNDGEIVYYDSLEELNNSEGGIYPFAQTDVIDTFFSGISDSNRFILFNFFKYYINDYLKEIENYIGFNINLNKENFNKNRDKFYEFNKIKNNRINELYKFIEEFDSLLYSPFRYSFHSLSKLELANIAESLIHMTYLKRKLIQI